MVESLGKLLTTLLKS